MIRARTALVLGYGRSGRAAECLLREEGCAVTVLAEETADLSELFQALEATTFDVCIVSPGFALSHPWMEAVRAAGVPFLSELELGWSRHQGRTVAVTGSNGKSTAVKWIYDMLRLAGQRVAIGGNYGIPACEIVQKTSDLDWLVLEVSSFQLETVRDFQAEVAVLLNVLPNHLDRHGSMTEYRRIKERIFGKTQDSTCVAPFDLIPKLEVSCNWISFGANPEATYSFKNGCIFQGLEKVADLSRTLFDSPILGRCTGAVGIAVADACGVPRAVAEKAARNFEPLPHRLEKLGEIDGVAYVNDSKATNLAAMITALEACSPGVHLIAGGVPKETDFTFVEEILAERTLSIYLIGQVSRAMYQAWNEVCQCVECGTLENAFKIAQNAAKSGETILLSPACASFDQFNSFEERGTQFRVLFQTQAQKDGNIL